MNDETLQWILQTLKSTIWDTMNSYMQQIIKLWEMDKFLSRPNQEKQSLNRSITGIEMVLKKLTTNKSPALDGFPVEFTRHPKNN
jgi:hypothetical protein